MAEVAAACCTQDTHGHSAALANLSAIAGCNLLRDFVDNQLRIIEVWSKSASAAALVTHYAGDCRCSWVAVVSSSSSASSGAQHAQGGRGQGGRHHQARHSAGLGVSGASAGVLSCPPPCHSAKPPYLLLTWPAAAAPPPLGVRSRCWTGPCQTCPGSCRWWSHSACSGSRTCMRMHAPVTVLLCCLQTDVHMQNCYRVDLHSEPHSLWRLSTTVICICFLHPGWLLLHIAPALSCSQDKQGQLLQLLAARALMLRVSCCRNSPAHLGEGQQPSKGAGPLGRSWLERVC